VPRLLVLGLLLAGAAGSGCGRGGAANAAKGAPGEAEAPEVIVAQPEGRTVTDSKDFDGYTDAVNTVQLRAHVTGYLDKVFFENREGFEVKEGAPLFKIDPRVYEADLDKAEAALLQAQALLNRLELDYKRAQELLSKHAIAQGDYDQTKGDRDAAAAAVKTAEAARESAQLNVGFTLVTAPFSGQVSRRLVDPGNLIQADITLLTTIVSLDPMYAYFDVDEGTMLQVRRLIRAGKVKSSRVAKMPVYLRLKDETGFPHQGVINFVDNAVDRMQGTLRARGVFSNPDRLLSPGLYAKIRLPIGLPHEAVLIAQRAVKTDQDRDAVYVLGPGNKVQYRRVRLGAIEDDGLRVVEKAVVEGGVVKEGLLADEWVVVDGLQRITSNGMEVRPKETGKMTADEPPAPKPAVPSGPPPAK
jgi:RND family efflux transporter MFP subunit